MITFSVLIAAVSAVILVFVLRRIKFASEDDDGKSERLSWVETLRSALLLGISIGFVVWLLTGGFTSIFSSEGVSCGRYQDMDSCVERYEQDMNKE